MYDYIYFINDKKNAQLLDTWSPYTKNFMLPLFDRILTEGAITVVFMGVLLIAVSDFCSFLCIDVLKKVS
jgi:hypothetical protein